MYILGISFGYHDSVALIKDGEVVFAAQEERYSRIKHGNSFLNTQLKKLFNLKIDLTQIDYMVYYENHSLNIVGF